MQRSRPLKIEVRKYRHLAIRYVMPRQDPMCITTMESYYPYRGEGKKGDQSRVKQRRKTAKLERPASYEVHLAADSIKKSIAAMSDPKFMVVAYFSVHGDTRKMLNRRPGIHAVLLDDDSLYYVLQWDDVLQNPMREGFDPADVSQMDRRRQRCRLPMNNFGRVEDGAKVYYLDLATDAESAIVVEAMKRVG